MFSELRVSVKISLKITYLDLYSAFQSAENKRVYFGTKDKESQIKVSKQTIVLDVDFVQISRLKA